MYSKHFDNVKTKIRFKIFHADFLHTLQSKNFNSYLSVYVCVCVCVCVCALLSIISIYLCSVVLMSSLVTSKVCALFTGQNIIVLCTHICNSTILLKSFAFFHKTGKC